MEIEEVKEHSDTGAVREFFEFIAKRLKRSMALNRFVSAEAVATYGLHRSRFRTVNFDADSETENELTEDEDKGDPMDI